MRKKSNAIQCVNNLRMLGVASAGYVAHYRGYLPHEDRGTGGKPPSDSSWYDLLPYFMDGSDDIAIRSSQVCQDKLNNFEKVYNKNTGVCYSYKMNSRLEDFRGSPVFRNIRSIKNKSKTVFLFDGRVDKKYYQFRPYGICKSVYQRHDNFAELLFIEGHVDVLNNSYSVENKWQDDRGLIWDPEK